MKTRRRTGEDKTAKRRHDGRSDAGEATVAGVVRPTTPAEHPSLPDCYRSRGYEESGASPLEYCEYDEVVLEKRLRSANGGD